MERLIFTLVLALTARLIYQLTGRNRRQLERVPEGMDLLCEPPGKRFVLYALGILVVCIVLFFGALYLMDGAPEEARPMWGLCLALAALVLGICLLGGRMLEQECVYFNAEELQITKAFRTPQTFRWSEITNVEGSLDSVLRLYTLDGTKVLTAHSGMVNFPLFRRVLKAHCPGASQYDSRNSCDSSQSHVLQYGAEYDLLAVMGLLIFAIDLALLFSAGMDTLLQELHPRSPSEWFALLFGPVCGVISLAYLLVFRWTKIECSPEKLVLRFPLRKPQELFWRELQQVEIVPSRQPGRENWKRLRLCTANRTCRLNLQHLTRGKDEFLTAMLHALDRYNIPCTRAKR